MKNTKFIYRSLFLVFVLLSSSVSIRAAKFSLRGTLINAKCGDSVFLYNAMSDSRSLPLEIAAIDSKGNFELSYIPSVTACYTLQFKYTKSVLCILNPRKTAYICIDGKTGMMLRTKNSKENTMLLNYHQILVNLEARKAECIKTASENMHFQEDMLKLEAERKAEIVKLCEANLNNYASAVLLEYLKVEDYKDLYEKVLGSLGKIYKNNEFLDYKNKQLQSSEMNKVL